MIDGLNIPQNTGCNCEIPHITMSLLIDIEKADKNDDGKLDTTELAQLIRTNKSMSEFSEEEILQIFDEIQTYAQKNEENKEDELASLELEDLEALIDELQGDTDTENTEDIENIEEIEEELPFFITEETDEANWTLHKESEKELDELILASGLLSEETAELKIKNSENLNRVYEEILKQKKNNPNITDEELSELYAELTQYLEERKSIEETILNELKIIEEDTQNKEKSELAKSIKDKITFIQEKRANFDYAQNNPVDIEDVEDTETVPPTETPDNAGGGGGGAKPGSITPEPPAETFDNMKEDKLKEEVIKRKGAYDEAKENLEKLKSENTLSAKKNDLNNAREKYDEVLKSIPEGDKAVDDKKAELQQKNEEIKIQEGTIASHKDSLIQTSAAISENNVNLTSHNQQLSILKNALGAWNSSNAEDTTNEKQKIQNEIYRYENELIPPLEEEIARLKEEKEKLETLIPEEEKKLEQLNQEKDKLEAELLELLNKNPELQASLKEASENVKKIENEIKEIEETRTEEIKKAQEDLTAKEKSYLEVKLIYERRTAEIKYPTKMEHTVVHEGEEYLSVLSQEEIEKLRKYAAAHGYANIYEGWSDKCLHAAYEYELYAEGDKASSLHQYMSEDLDETVQKMAETLNNGNTVVAKVNTKKGTRHFVLVIGIKKDAKAPYKESDFLCIDSYNHEVDKMGQPGQEALDNGNYRTLYSQHGKYWLGSHVVDFS